MQKRKRKSTEVNLDEQIMRAESMQSHLTLEELVATEQSVSTEKSPQKQGQQ